MLMWLWSGTSSDILLKTRQGVIGFLRRPGISTVSATAACSKQRASLLISVKQSIDANNLYVYSCITVSELQRFSRETAHFAIALC
jgi:hypothetical protein